MAKIKFEVEIDTNEDREDLERLLELLMAMQGMNNNYEEDDYE